MTQYINPTPTRYSNALDPIQPSDLATKKYVDSRIGGNNANFTYTPETGLVPLVINFTDLTNPVPTGWVWTVGGNGVTSVDYSFTNGTIPTSQNPQITFNRSTLYTVTLTPTKTGLVYNAFTVAITPTPTPVIYGDLTVGMAFGSPVGAVSKAFYDYTATDVFAVTVNKVNVETCLIVTRSIIIVTGSPPPNISITANNVNNGDRVNSDVISQPNFPASYTTNVQAEMNNSDSSATNKSPISNAVNYYVPALYIQNQNVTVPTFAVPYQQVKLTDYVAGQSLVFVSGNNIQVVWVAFPKTFTTPPNAYVVTQGFPPGVVSRVSDTPAPQTINGQLYNIYGFQLGTTGDVTLTSSLYLETVPNVIQEVKQETTQSGA